MKRSVVKPRMSDEAVHEKTGRTWSKWFALLDAAGADKLEHREIVAILQSRYGLGPWWQQMVTVSYEQARGLRAKHEKPEGFEISRTLTMSATPRAVFDIWTDTPTRDRWLETSGLTIRTAVAPKRLRLTWADGRTSVEVSVSSRGAGRTQVSVQHSKLANARTAARMKTYWRDKLRELATSLEN